MWKYFSVVKCQVVDLFILHATLPASRNSRTCTDTRTERMTFSTDSLRIAYCLLQHIAQVKMPQRHSLSPSEIHFRFKMSSLHMFRLSSQRVTPLRRVQYSVELSSCRDWRAALSIPHHASSFLSFFISAEYRVHGNAYALMGSNAPSMFSCLAGSLAISQRSIIVLLA